MSEGLKEGTTRQFVVGKVFSLIYFSIVCEWNVRSLTYWKLENHPTLLENARRVWNIFSHRARWISGKTYHDQRVVFPLLYTRWQCKYTEMYAFNWFVQVRG